MSYLTRKSHGGMCCGINHVHSFTMSRSEIRNIWGTLPAIEATTLRELKQKIAESTGSLVEAVLTRQQLQANDYELEKLMTKAKFKLVSTFKNKNTGAQCYVFHYYKAYRRQKNDLPLVLPSAENQE